MGGNCLMFKALTNRRWTHEHSTADPLAPRKGDINHGDVTVRRCAGCRGTAVKPQTGIMVGFGLLSISCHLKKDTRDMVEQGWPDLLFKWTFDRMRLAINLMNVDIQVLAILYSLWHSYILTILSFISIVFTPVFLHATCSVYSQFEAVSSCLVLRFCEHAWNS